MNRVAACYERISKDGRSGYDAARSESTKMWYGDVVLAHMADPLLVSGPAKSRGRRDDRTVI